MWLSRLFVKGIISSTRSGIREYLTWPELETEILSELDSHDGRVSFLELEVGVLRWILDLGSN